MAMNPSSSDDDDDYCPICLESLYQSRIATSPAANTEQSEVSSSISDSPSCKSTIGINVPCGHCFHVSCYQQWKAIETEQNGKPSCPTCKFRTPRFVYLHDFTNNGSAVNQTTIASPHQLVNSMGNTVICVPCGHLYHVSHEWHEWIDKTIQLKQHEQKSFWTSTLQPQQQPLEITIPGSEQQTSDCGSESKLNRSHGQCPLCHITVACVLRVYTKLTPINPVSILNHLIDDSRSISSLSNPTASYATTRTSKNITDADIPNCILVTGAGNPVVNGLYMWNGTYVNHAKRYIRYGVWNNMVCNFNIFLCRLRSGENYWFISFVTDFANECTDADIDFYRAPIFDSYPTIPPQDGWKIVGSSMLGSNPCPTIVYQHYDPVTGHVQEIKQLPAPIDDQVMDDAKSTSGDMDESDDISLTAIFFSHTIDVHGAGNPAVNGKYVYDGQFHSASRYFRYGLWNGVFRHFYIILWATSDTTQRLRWTISVVPPNVDPGAVSDLHIIYYATPMESSSRMVPPCHGWSAVNDSGGIEPPPRLVHHEYVDNDDSNNRNNSNDNDGGSPIQHTLNESSIDWEAAENLIEFRESE